MRINNKTREMLSFTTAAQASNRTESEDPKRTKQYLYPISDQDFVTKGVENLLNDEII